jgi:hypothetical protein
VAVRWTLRASLLLAFALSCEAPRNEPVLPDAGTGGSAAGGTGGFKPVVGGGGFSPDAAPDLRGPPDLPPPPDAAVVAPADFTPHLGTWVFSQGSIAINCPDTGQAGTDSVTGLEFQLQRGLDSSHVIVMTPCQYKVDVEGTSAVFRGGQTCTEVTSQGGRTRYTVIQGRFTPSAPEASFALEMTLVDPDAAGARPCTATILGMAKKKPPPPL